jgi:hypothetical protein
MSCKQKQFLLKIDEELFEKFVQSCGDKDITEVLTKLIKKFIRDKEISDSFNKESDITKEIIFKKYLEKIQK